MVAAGRVPLRTVVREWTRIGCVGFGGPPAHIALLRDLCVARRGWLTERAFEDGIAATNLLPGPASTQLAILCAWRVAGVFGALVGGLGFILPGLVAIVALAAVFLAGSPPEWILGAGAGAGAAVPAVAVAAGAALAPASWRRAASAGRWAAYLALGFAAVVAVGPWLVAVLIACGAGELLWRRGGGAPRLDLQGWPLAALLAAATTAGGLGALAWTALKVGALSYGGGFVIVPLMQADAVDVNGWMTGAEFANAVALGQVTPGPVVQTVAVVGFAAAGLGGAALASLCAFAPSFAFILIGADRFDRLAADGRVRAFLDGAGPAAIGAILGSAIPLALALGEPWQLAVLAVAAVALLAARRGVVATLLAAGAVGGALALAGAPLPG
ncbi:MAG: chromate efflux transporter [Solirubrobacterales bacterium]|nr:chromate efflux transporter [Solirubrobacterales bacterium]